MRFGGDVHTGAVKSFPVDGQTEPEGTARTIDAVGGDPATVSPSALLITPRNVGLRPTLSVIDVSRRVDRADNLLARAADIRELAREVAPTATLGPVGDRNADPARRRRFARARRRSRNEVPVSC